MSRKLLSLNDWVIDKRKRWKSITPQEKDRFFMLMRVYGKPKFEEFWNRHLEDVSERNRKTSSRYDSSEKERPSLASEAGSTTAGQSLES